MSKKISEMPAKANMVAADEFTILDSEDPAAETKNKRVGRTAALADRQPVVPAGGANYLGQDPDWVLAGDSATRDVGTRATDVAAGDAPDAAVSAHTSTFDHSRIQTANQKDAADNANNPSGPNPYATIADVPVISGLHADLPDLATSGHPGTVITIPAGTPGNAVNIAADGSLQDSGKAVGAVNHADLPDLSVSGHPGTVITIPAGVQGNAVSIAADGTLQDAGAQVNIVAAVNGSDSITVSPTTGTPIVGLQGDVAVPGNSKYYGTSGAGVKGWHDLPPGGGGGVTKGTPFVVGDVVEVQSDTGDGIIRSVGFTSASVLRQGGTINDWGEKSQSVAESGNETFDLDDGHFFTNSTPLTADKTVNFTSGANQFYTAWTALLDIGGFTPTWEFDGAPIDTADGYSISAGGWFLFTFVRSGSKVVVSERGVP